MDLLSQHEAFLRAIFDAPDDDTPRLVYADFLQENGEEEHAELIRVQCELARLPSYEVDPGPEYTERRFHLLTRQAVLLKKESTPEYWNRGFQNPGYHVWCDGNDLHDVLALRQRAVRDTPHMFAATAVSVWLSVPR